MDELTLLRRLDADTPAPSKAALGDAFDALTERIEAEGQRGRNHVARARRHRRVRRVLLASACVVALAAGFLFTDTVGVAGLRPGATAEAAEVLDQAAETAITTADPVVRPGQFLRIRTAYQYMNVAGTQDRPLRWLRGGIDTTYIPFDRADEWVLVRTEPRPVAFFSEAAKKEALNSLAEWEPRYGGRAELLRGRKGDFYGTPADQVGFSDLPRDPRLLLNRVYRETLGKGLAPDDQAVDWFATQLRSGVVPADLRAAMYRAVALVPGVTLSESDATLDGRRGVAIGRTEPWTGVRRELVIEPTTGLLIGEREIWTRAAEGVPAGKVTGSTAVTTTVVDSAPSGPEHRVQ